MRETLAANRQFLIVVAIALGVVVALIPLARVADQKVDRARPMYADTQRVAFLEYRHIELHGAPVPLKVTSGDTAVVGAERFTPSTGTSVTVRPYAQGFCVRAVDPYGDTTGWRCWRRGVDPRVAPGFAP